jgi:hypothetical protein
MSSTAIATPEHAASILNDKEVQDATGSRDSDVSDSKATREGAPKDLRFWLIIFGLLIATFLSALDMTGQ